MNVGTFKVASSEKLTSAINRNYSDLSYGLICKIIKQKDVKVNGKRVSADIQLSAGDEVIFYYKAEVEKKIEIVYEDENLIIANKPKNIETISDSGVSLLTKIQTQTQKTLYAVHRLDRNTEGLVVFAKNEKSKASLDSALKNRTLEKFYLAWVFGTFEKPNDELVAYLKKDSKNSKVYILDEMSDGYQKIQTNYKVLKEYDNSSIVEVELITGKTHQIRAHFAHIGHCLIGDEKYGEVSVNRQFGKRTQCLVSYKIKFHFDSADYLSYLDNMVVELTNDKIDFLNINK